MADKYLLEDGSGSYLLEDGSGSYLLEGTDPSCVVEPTGGFFWLFEDGSIMALEDCTGGWLIEDQSGYAPSTDTPAAPPPGGITHKRKGKAEKDTRRRRILLPDGRILIPANDEEYRRAVEQIMANLEAGEETVEPPTPRKRRLKGAVVAPAAVPRLAVPTPLPMEFYNALELYRQGVLNYLTIQRAWAVYLAEQDEDEAVTLLLVN